MTAAKNLAVREVIFAKGDVLMREGDLSGELWILRSGQVEVFRERQGRVFVLAELGPGEMLGTMTATTGSARTASVRATEPGSASVIPKEQVRGMIKGLPQWANALINDLVARVSYANELYIETAVAIDTGAAADTPMRFAIRCARTVASLAQTLAVAREEQMYVPLDASLPLFGQILGDADQTRSLIDLFFNEGLLVAAPRMAPGRNVPLAMVADLALFADAAAKTLEGQEKDSDFVAPFAPTERRILQELVALGRAKVQDGGTQVSVELKEAEESMRRQGHELKTELLVRAHRLGYLRFDKSQASPLIAFDGHWLDHMLKSLNVMRIIAASAGDGKRQGKRTLLY